MKNEDRGVEVGFRLWHGLVVVQTRMSEENFEDIQVIGLMFPLHRLWCGATACCVSPSDVLDVSVMFVIEVGSNQVLPMKESSYCVVSM